MAAPKKKKQVVIDGCGLTPPYKSEQATFCDGCGFGFSNYGSRFNHISGKVYCHTCYMRQMKNYGSEIKVPKIFPGVTGFVPKPFISKELTKTEKQIAEGYKEFEQKIIEIKEALERLKELFDKIPRLDVIINFPDR